jgi:ATP-dependent RNA helicase DDX24/MAK5
MSNYAVARAASKRRKLAHPLPPPSATPSTTDSKSKSKNKSTVLSSRPAARTRTERASNLAWKNVVLPSEFGFDEEGGLLELEEVEGVEVVYGEGLVTFRVSCLASLSPLLRLIS